MGTKSRSFTPLPNDVSLENLVPEDHFYRRLEARLDLSFVRELVEPLFAEGKLWHGMRRFRMRTLRKVNTEALMPATGQNIKRLLASGGRGPEILAQAAVQRLTARPRLDDVHRKSLDQRRKCRVTRRFSTGWLVSATTCATSI